MGKIKEVEEAMMLNTATARDYEARLKMIATSIFTYEGLDDIGGSNRFLEQVLYEDGRACFVYDKELGYLTLRANPTDKINVYNLPSKIEAWSFGYNKQYDIDGDNCVFIMNNELMRPTRETISLFSRKLYEIDRSIDINVKAQRTPVLIEGTEKERLTLKNLYMQYDGNMPFIFGNKNFNLSEALKAIDTKAPYVADKLTQQKYEYLSEVLTFLGINNNINVFKKERMITDEVNANDNLINVYLNCFYKTRKRAVDEINKKFDLNIELKVDFNEVEKLINGFDDIDMEEIEGEDYE